MNSHTGLRPYVCRVCSRAFGDSSSLSRHTRTHAGMRPYKCKEPWCGKDYTRKATLRIHEVRNHLEGSGQGSVDRRGSRHECGTHEPELVQCNLSGNVIYATRVPPRRFDEAPPRTRLPNLLHDTNVTPPTTPDVATSNAPSWAPSLAQRRPVPMPSPLCVANLVQELQRPCTPTTPVMDHVNAMTLQNLLTTTLTPSPVCWSAPTTPAYPTTPVSAHATPAQCDAHSSFLASVSALATSAKCEPQSPFPTPALAQASSVKYEDSSPLATPVSAQTATMYDAQNPLLASILAGATPIKHETQSAFPTPLSAPSTSAKYEAQDAFLAPVSAHAPVPYEAHDPIFAQANAHETPIKLESQDPFTFPLQSLVDVLSYTPHASASAPRPSS